ncbi:NifB/NifX family molybdenum-iron cluster-binding protein [bacterium]|nr:NifB/NifX family molybdenum-iron cluster-binding protein [bacterium]
MKIAVSSQGMSLDSEMDPRFGRAKYFLVIDSDTGQFTVHDNTQNLNAMQGAGIQAAKNVVDLNVEAVITGNVGPKAYAALKAADIKIYLCEKGSVKQAVDKFQAGQLSNAGQANQEGHWV